MYFLVQGVACEWMCQAKRHVLRVAREKSYINPRSRATIDDWIDIKVSIEFSTPRRGV
jgi:hypothetical protein